MTPLFSRSSDDAESGDAATDDVWVARTKDKLGELGDFDVLEKVRRKGTFVCRNTPASHLAGLQESAFPARVNGTRGEPMSLETLRRFFPTATAAVRDEAEFRAAVFRGGLTPEARREAWVYFLGHRWYESGNACDTVPF